MLKRKTNSDEGREPPSGLAVGSHCSTPAARPAPSQPAAAPSVHPKLCAAARALRTPVPPHRRVQESRLRLCSGFCGFATRSACKMPGGRALLSLLSTPSPGSAAAPQPHHCPHGLSTAFTVFSTVFSAAFQPLLKTSSMMMWLLREPHLPLALPLLVGSTRMPQRIRISAR